MEGGSVGQGEGRSVWHECSGRGGSPGNAERAGMGLFQLRNRGQGNFLLPGSFPTLLIEHDLGGHRLLSLAAERPDKVRKLRASRGRLIAE